MDKWHVKEEIIYKVGPVKPKDNEIEENKKSEEEKEPKAIILEDIKLDEYFTQDQQKFYKSLYETEQYDRAELKTINKS